MNIQTALLVTTLAAVSLARAESGLTMAAYAPIDTDVEITSLTLGYRADGTAQESFVALPASAKTAPAPAILICYNWMGPSLYFEHRAKALASMGYVAMVADPYGTDLRPSNTQEASAATSSMYADPATFRARLQSSLTQLRGLDAVDAERIAAIGYCFGGASVLELARANAPLKGVVSFHGALKTQMPAEGSVAVPMLVLHGDVDPFVPDSEVDAFLAEMRGATADFQFVRFSQAVHSFTNPNANMPGKAEYHAPSAVRSWEMALDFLSRVLDHPRR